MVRLAIAILVCSCHSEPPVSCGAGTQLRGTSCVAIDAAPVATPGAGSAVREPAPGLAYQLTHDVTIDPSFSPDGKRMVYITIVAGKEQLFVSDIDGAHATQLTHDDVDHEDPAWSPKEPRIAYVRIASNTEVIHWIQLDGSGDEALTPPGTKTIHPSFSPDGKLLAYCTDDDLQPPKKNDSDIYTLDLASRQITRRITGGTNTYPRFSPDGKRFAFRRMTGEINSEVFIADLDGGNAQNLSNSPWFDGWPAWSPDGAWIAFASNRRQNYQIYVMRADGSDVRLVAPTEGRATAPTWTRDGQRIYFSNCRKVDFTYDCEILVARAPIS